MTAKAGPSRRPSIPTDIGARLGLVGPGAWAMWALYCTCYLVVVFVFSPISLASVGCLVLVAAGAFVLVGRSPTPLPPRRTVVTVACAVVAIIVLASTLPGTWRPPAPGAWELGAVNFLAFGLVLRGRLAVGWAVDAIMVVALTLWGIVAGNGPLLGLEATYGQVGSLVAGTVFAVALHRTAHHTLLIRDAERERATVEARLAASAAVADAELALVRERAIPTLRAIADGRSPEREDARILEAELRDLLRGRALAIEPLVGALRAARRRGVDVLLLDDLGDRPVAAEALRDAATWCAARLELLRSGSLALRILTVDGSLLVTATLDGADAGRLETPLAAASDPAP